MEKRAISLGLVATLVFYFIAKLLLAAHKRLTAIMDENPSSFFWPISNSLQEPITILPWLIPGALVGFLCTKNPVKNGAITGAIYGTIVSILGFIIASSQAYDATSKLTHLSYGLSFIAKSAFLYAFAAPLGYLMAAQRRAL